MKKIFANKNNTIRVAHIVGKFVGGGVESVVMNYYRHIDRDKIQFDFIVDKNSTLVPKEEIEYLGGRIFYIPSYKSQLLFQKSLRKLISEYNWNIIQSHINYWNVFPLYVAKKNSIPIRIAHCHTSRNRVDIYTLPKLILKSKSKRYATHYFACSDYAGISMFGKNSNFDIIYNAIELEKFKYSIEKRCSLREKLKIPKDYFVVGHVGRFGYEKNHEFIVKMFNELLTSRPKSYLLFVGSGEKMDLIKKIVNDFGIQRNVIFMGQCNNMQAIYSAFDIFILPSLFEGQPLVGIEAQVSGLECLFSNNVPKEVDITNTSKFLSIKNRCLWSKTLTNKKIKSDHERLNINLSCFGNYDIIKQSEILTTKYLKLFNNII